MVFEEQAFKGVYIVNPIVFYDERGSYQKVINVNIQNDFESIQNVFIVLDEK